MDVTSKAVRRVVAIASSTGGPTALQTLIPLLPGGLCAPVLIVQHMPGGFTKALAERLDILSSVSVKEAAEGDALKPGVVYLAKGGQHMHVVPKDTGHAIHYTDLPNREGVRPCANYMYESLAECGYDEVICVVLTGMGADGTEGISNLKQKKKVRVYTQEQAGCTVYGMPRSVVEAGLSDGEMTLQQIAEEIKKIVGVTEDGCKPIS